MDYGNTASAQIHAHALVPHKPCGQEWWHRSSQRYRSDEWAVHSHWLSLPHEVSGTLPPWDSHAKETVLHAKFLPCTEKRVKCSRQETNPTSPEEKKDKNEVKYILVTACAAASSHSVTRSPSPIQDGRSVKLSVWPSARDRHRFGLE